ncbi:MAG: hypothetical protein CVV57_08525 [Tenericutes bacterium HGW-Tenericutes-2]|jgi:hypothetical protein|nr:MAG: hypothetical protein CVV57_08525 [Tenericutes bacterium HGW-Tenericutes-2]
MKKRILFMALVLLSAFVLVACNTTPTEEPTPTPTPAPVLSAITFSGTADITLDFQASFNVLTGVTATGNDGLSYTSQITYVSTSTISATHMLDTTKTGSHAIRYEVKVGTITAQTWRYITVKSPTSVEGEYLINPDFALGTAGWDDPGVVYNADGSSMTLSVEDGALKAEVVAGSNVFTPRFGQMNVPFEKDQAYRVTFEAKSSVEKTINLQVGELLPSAPWFTDFKPNNTVHRLITTEWATYSYEFMHTLDNKRGGLLFELGALNGLAVNATLWFDNIVIEPVTLGEDETAPMINGVANKSILVNGTFDPLAGVTAVDDRDGDITDQMVVVIKDSTNAVVTTIDTSAEATYTITYTVEDAAGNETTVSMTLEIVAMQFSDANKVVNPSFNTALNVTTPEWAVWSQDWGTAPVVVHGIDTVAGVYTVDITGGGDAAWAVQLHQSGLITVEEGKTYRLMFNIDAEVARSINVAVGYNDGGWVEYARENAIAITTTEATYEILFTVTKPTHIVNIVFELGSQPGFADGLVTLYDVKLQEALLDEIVTNGDFSNLGWFAFSNDWDGSQASLTVVNGEFVYGLNKYVGGGASWMLQLIYATKVVLEADTAYTFTFDAYASKDLSIAPFFTQGEAGGWNNLVTTGPVALTTVKDTYTLSFTTGSSVALPFEFKFEFGNAFTPFEAGVDDAVAQFIVFDNLSMKKTAAESPEILMNGTADQVLGFTLFTEADGQGTMTYVDGKMVLDITGVAANAWQPHLYQMIGDLAPGKYVLKFVIQSDVTRDLRVNLILPDAGYASILPDTKYDFNVEAGVEKVVVVEFTVANLVTNVKFELDFGTLGGTLVSLPGEFTISEILIYPNFN